jgi:hypothetical protein
MFYIVEQLKGLPKETIPVKALHFGSDNVYDYFILGCTTPEEIVNVDYYNYKKVSKEWYCRDRKNNVDSFLTQIRAITKREGFGFTNKVISFKELNEYLR